MSAQKRISQVDLPRQSLVEALRLPKSLVAEYAGEPTAPLDLAMAVGVKPTSSKWRDLTGSAVGYGLTEGGYKASHISLTDLGRQAVSPTEEGEDTEALREACLKPTVVGGFLRKYDGSKFPREDIAKNVLQRELGVPADRTAAALAMIVANADFVGVFREMSGDRYVALAPLTPKRAPVPVEQESTILPEIPDDSASPPEGTRESGISRIFISHSKNHRVLDQVKMILELADLEAEVAVEQETEAMPVPDKVFASMSRSDAAIICVTADDGEKGENGYRVNSNVLIEIGAAYVRYDKRIVLLWDRRVEVPSNLQGLYRCEFEGDDLSWDAGTRLQKALIAIKKGNPPS